MSEARPEPSAATPARRARGRPRKQDPAAEGNSRRQNLVLAAAKLFRAKGFAATSTRDIAAAADMQAGSPFYHFASKQALLSAVMQEGMRRALARQSMDMAKACSQPGQQALSARAALQVLIRSHLEVLLGPDIDFITVMLYEWRSLSQAGRLAITQQKDAYEAVWQPVLLTLHNEGMLLVEPKLARLMIFGALNWSVRWFTAQGAVSLDQLAQASMRLFIHPESTRL